jgi:hypothetical protein
MSPYSVRSPIAYSERTSCSYTRVYGLLAKYLYAHQQLLNTAKAADNDVRH